MFSEYAKGRTPNPDVMCNSRIKFDAFLKAARDLGADYVATGHYCRKDVADGPDGRPVYRILAGADGNKDQSYFLCQLTQEQIGDIVKPEVRRLAREAGLPSAEKKDSQGICFVGKVDLPVFLQQKLAAREGNVVEIFPDFYGSLLKEYPGYAVSSGGCGNDSWDGAAVPEAGGGFCQLLPDEVKALARAYHYKESDGKKIGTHIGAQYYTIGQRKGLNIGGHREPIFVLDTSVQTNTIYVARPPDGPRGGASLSGPDTLPPAPAAGIPLLPRRRDVHCLRPASEGHNSRTVRGLVRSGGSGDARQRGDFGMMAWSVVCRYEACADYVTG